MRKTAAADSAAFIRRKRKNCRQKCQVSKSSLPQTDKLKTDFNASHLHVGKVLVKAKDVNFHYPSLVASPMETTRPEAVKELWSSSLTFQLRSGDRLSLKRKKRQWKNNPAETHHGRIAPTDGVMERAGFTSVYLDQEYSLVRNERSVLNKQKLSTTATCRNMK